MRQQYQESDAEHLGIQLITRNRAETRHDVTLERMCRVISLSPFSNFAKPDIHILFHRNVPPKLFINLYMHLIPNQQRLELRQIERIRSQILSD